MLPLILSGLGLLLGIRGCYLTIRKAMFDIYHTEELFNLWEENQELFRWKNRLIHKIERAIFGKNLIKQASIPNNVRILQEGNDVIIGFILILVGFFSQFVAILITLCREF